MYTLTNGTCRKIVGQAIVCVWLVLGANAAYGEGDVHPEVQKALDWQMPSHDCGEQPFLRNVNNTTNQAEETVTSDIDHYTRKRHERKLKRWTKCYESYRSELVEDFGWLRDSAQFGMTQEQAQVVLGHMKSIQNTLQPAE